MTDSTFDARQVDPRVRLAMRILEFEQTRPPDVEDVAARVGLSPDHLAHLFSDQVGEACASFSRRIRLENSVNQLMHDPVPLNVVAAWFGYASQAAYTRAFTRHFGCAPRRYAGEVLGQSQQDYARAQLDAAGRGRGAVGLDDQAIVLTQRPTRTALARRFYGQMSPVIGDGCLPTCPTRSPRGPSWSGWPMAARARRHRRAGATIVP